MVKIGDDEVVQEEWGASRTAASISLGVKYCAVLSFDIIAHYGNIVNYNTLEATGF